MLVDPAPDDEVTIVQLYDELKGRLERYALRLVRDPDRADDLVQETFARALAHSELLGQLNPYQRRAWSYRVLKNLFLDQRRARQRERALLGRLAWQEWVESIPDPLILSPDLFARIPERYAEVLYRRYVLGMTSHEIGEELGIPAATVRSRIRLAVKWLRAHPSEIR